MQYDEMKVQRLAVIINEFFPDKEKNPETNCEKRRESGLPPLSQDWAEHILLHEQYLRDTHGKFRDKDSFEKLALALRETCEALAELSGQGRMLLMFASGLLETTTEWDELPTGFEEQAKLLRDGAEQVRKAKGDLRPPRRNANWRGVSVYEACAGIWRSETGSSAPTMNAETQYSSAFGRFVIAVFDALGIGSTPRVAQDALARWRREQRKIT
mgnify:CR=1 FL=1